MDKVSGLRNPHAKLTFGLQEAPSARTTDRNAWCWCWGGISKPAIVAGVAKTLAPVSNSSSSSSSSRRRRRRRRRRRST